MNHSHDLLISISFAETEMQLRLIRDEFVSKALLRYKEYNPQSIAQIVQSIPWCIEYRTWRTDDGKFSVELRFEISIPLSFCSESDFYFSTSAIPEGNQRVLVDRGFVFFKY